MQTTYLTKNSDLGYTKNAQKSTERGFPSGPVVKNQLGSIKDTGLIPGSGSTHMPWRVPQLLRLSSRACEPQLLSPCAATTEAHGPRACGWQQEKSLQGLGRRKEG